MKTPHVPLSLDRRIEIELLVNAHPNHRSSGIIRELLKEIDELNKRLDKREAAKARREAFEPPTHAQVTAEFERLGMNGESRGLAQAFIAHYEARGWCCGKVKMRKWQAACITWRRNHIMRQGALASPPEPTIRRSAEPRL